MEPLREVWYLAETDQIIEGVHPKEWCKGPCVIHGPSDHPMRLWSLGFDLRRKSFYRICEHGVKHQDPDEREYWTLQLERAYSLAMNKLSSWKCPVHFCGCCAVNS